MYRLRLTPVPSLLKNVCRSALPRRNYSEKTNDLQPKVTNNETSQNVFRNKKKPTEFDKKVFLWSGRYKKREDIPEYVTPENISGARSNLRVKVSMAMIVSTIIGCIYMIQTGKKAVREEDTLIQRNLEKKAKLREEGERERNLTASLKNH